MVLLAYENQANSFTYCPDLDKLQGGCNSSRGRAHSVVFNSDKVYQVELKLNERQ